MDGAQGFARDLADSIDFVEARHIRARKPNPERGRSALAADFVNPDETPANRLAHFGSESSGFKILGRKEKVLREIIGIWLKCQGYLVGLCDARLGRSI